jgi:hypothetical protein
MSAFEVVLSIAATALLVVGFIHFLHDMTTGCRKFLRYYQALLLLALGASFGSCLLFPRHPSAFVVEFLKDVGSAGYLTALILASTPLLLSFIVFRKKRPITHLADLKLASPVAVIGSIAGGPALLYGALYFLDTNDFIYQSAIWIVFATAVTFPVALFAPIMAAWVDITTLMHQFGFETYEGYTIPTALRFLGLDDSIDHYMAAVALLGIVLAGDLFAVFDDPQL